MHENSIERGGPVSQAIYSAFHGLATQVEVDAATPHVGKIIKERGEGVICAEQIQAYRSMPAGHLPVLVGSPVCHLLSLLTCLCTELGALPAGDGSSATPRPRLARRGHLLRAYRLSTTAGSSSLRS